MLPIPSDKNSPLRKCGIVRFFRELYHF